MALTNSAAEIYEAIEFGSFEYHGLQIDVTGIPPMKLAKLAIKDFKGGRIGDLEFQGIDGASLTGDKYLVGRFSLKGLKISDLIRLSGRMTPGYGNRQPQPNQMAERTLACR